MNPRRSTLASITAMVLLIATLPVALQAQTRAEATAKRMYDSRTPAGEAASQLKRSFRAADEEVVRLLDYAGYRADQVAGAATGALRMRPTEAAEYMAAAGLSTREVATGLARGSRLTGRRALDVLEAAGLRGVADPAVYRSSRASAADITGFLSDKGEPSEKAARDLVATHRLDSGAVARELVKEYPVVDVSRALRDNFRMDGTSIRSFWKDEGVDEVVVDAALLDLGFEPEEIPRPMIEHFEIADYRVNAGPGDRIANQVNIVSRPAVLPAASDLDGIVWFRGSNLDRPETEVWVNTEEGTPLQATIRSRTQEGFQDVLEVEVPEFTGKGIRVTTDGGWSGYTNVRGIGYAPIETSLFEEALDGLFVNVVGGTYTVMFGDAVLTGTIDDQQQNSIELVITRLQNDGFSVRTEEAQTGVDVVVTIPFDGQGREFAGTYFSYIPCWTCGETTVPKADCPSLTMECLTQHLGTLIASLGQCSDLSLWEEEEILDTAGVPFVGDLSNAELDIRMRLYTGQSGMTAGPTTFEFRSDVSVETVGVTIDEDDLDAYVNDNVTLAMNASQEESLAVYLLAGIRQYGDILGWGHLLTVDRMSDGRLFVTFLAN